MISMLAPSRGRAEMMQASINSLAQTAADSSSYEVIVALDEDDASNYRDLTGCKFITVPNRPGYKHLEVYFNALAEEAQGEWHFGWNDDAIMQTMHWDALIHEHEPAVVLSAVDQFHGRAMPTFPIWPARWVEILGHVSLSCAIDSWIMEVGRLLDRVQDVDILVYHDRPDTTGRAPDQTHNERQSAEPAVWASQQSLRVADAETLRRVL